MQNAIITGLVGNNSIPSQVLGTCPSANCTWNMYTSLAFCSTVQNVTSTMVEHCSERQQGVTSSGEISFAVPFNRTCNVSTSALEDKGNITSPTANLGISYYFDPQERAYTNGVVNPQIGVYTPPDVVKMDVFYMQQELRDNDGKTIEVFFMPPVGKLALQARITICLQTFKTDMVNGTTHRHLGSDKEIL